MQALSLNREGNAQRTDWSFIKSKSPKEMDPQMVQEGVTRLHSS